MKDLLSCALLALAVCCATTNKPQHQASQISSALAECNSLVASATGCVCGVVVREHSLKPINHAALSLVAVTLTSTGQPIYGAEWYVATDKDGHYCFANVPAGQLYMLKIVAKGRISVVRSALSVASGFITTFNATMPRAGPPIVVH